MSVQLQGYKTVFPNEVYERDKVVRIKEGEPIETSEIVITRTYTTPTEDQVIDHLRNTAKEVEAIANLIIPQRLNDEERNPLEQLLIELPNACLRDIVNGDEGCMNYLRANTPALDTSSQYLRTWYGLIPKKIIERHKDEISINGSNWYSAALSNDDLRKAGFGEKWSLRILLEDWKLPEKDAIDFLLNHGTHGSRTLDVSKTNYPVVEVRQFLDIIYTSFGDIENLKQLKDVSQDVLEECSIKPVRTLLENIRKGQILEAMKKRNQGNISSIN